MTQYNNIQSKTKYNLSLALLLGVMAISCQKQKDETPQNQEKLVDVSLNIGFSEETDGYELAQTTRGDIDEDAAFNFELVPTPKTRANTNTPDQLYNLEIRQYDANGTYLKGTHFGSTTKKIGESLTIMLTSATNCQLVIVAWGNNVNTSTTLLGAKSLKEAMDVAYPAASVQSIPTTDAAPMNGMPYVLHLKNINVSSSGAIQSGTSEVDARIRLKRMASLLSVNWTYNVSGYKLNQVLLQSIPLNFRVVPNPDANDGTFPSLIDQFTTIQLTASEIAKGSYSRWVPANVRGNMATANSITNRYKATAPQGSVFANFVATNENDAKKKLDYRIYIGGANVTNFDLLPNTNYTYRVNFAHTGIPLNDKRVTYIDPIPASQNNNNFMPTANCFMVVPGGSFSFDPTKMRINGSDTDNTILKGWGTIASVKLLWQTKENGDVGDPVMGIVNTNTDHSNIVEYNSTSKRIYCRVAPNTSGGSGVIAAYDSGGKILWSWHVWVTDYNPSATGKTTVVTPENERIQKYGTTTKLFMDRNLGAVKGFTSIPSDGLERSKANGFHYQRARKDPFPSSYTTKETLGQVYKFTSAPGSPPENVLNRYGSDGITLIIPVNPSSEDAAKYSYSLRQAYQNPIQISSSKGGDWGTDPFANRGDWGVPKTFHDPCPAGWRVPTKSEVTPLLSAKTKTVVGAGTIEHEPGRWTFFRFTGYPPNAGQLNFVGARGYLMVIDRNTPNAPGYVLQFSNDVVQPQMSILDSYDAHTLRCIQER